MIKLRVAKNETGAIEFIDYQADTAEIAALFPKSAKMTSGIRWNIIRLYSNGVTGEKNEAGIKRTRSIIATATKLGLAIDATGVDSIEELTAAL